MADPDTPKLEILLEQQAEMTKLAQALLGDAAEADDVVQEVLVRALGSPGSVKVTFQGSAAVWAKRVIENAVRDRRRGEGRRAQREAESARADVTAGTEETILAIERQRGLLDAVVALDEPYRTVILLRYFENLPLKEIARRTGQSTEAVRKQSQRGLAKLRAGLEDRLGGDGAWALALLPVAAGTSASKATAVGSVGVLKALMLGLLLLGGAAIGIRALLADTSPRQPASGLDQVVAAGETEELPGGGSELDSSPRQAGTVTRQALKGGSETSNAETSNAETSNTETSNTETSNTGKSSDRGLAPSPLQFSPGLRARVVNEYGAPFDQTQMNDVQLAFLFNERGVRISGGAESVALEMNAKGWVESDRVPNQGSMGLGRLAVTKGSFAVLGAGPMHPGSVKSSIVLIPGVQVSGSVLNEGGQPVAGAPVRLIADIEALGTYPGGLLTTSAGRHPVVVTDQQGRFDLGNTPWHARFSVEAGSRTLGLASSPLPKAGGAALQLRLVPETTAEVLRIQGRVVEADGAPVAGATIHAGWLESVTDANGSFLIETSSSQLATLESYGHRLAAIAPDKRFVQVDLTTAGARDQVLRLPAVQETLATRWVDEDGAAITGAHVFVYDGSSHGSSSRTLENPYEGAAPRTDRNGRISLTHLNPRPYILRVIREDPFLVWDAFDVLPGSTSEATFVVPPRHSVPQWAGRATDWLGNPLPGIQVQVAAYHAPEGRTRMRTMGPAATTDEGGGFSFSGIPAAGVILEFDARPGDSRRGTEINIENLAMSNSGDIKLDLECELQPTLREGFASAYLRFYDSSGNPLRVTQIAAGGTKTSDRIEQDADGTFGRLLTTQRLARIDVHGPSDELQRSQPIAVSPIEVTRLEL